VKPRVVHITRSLDVGGVETQLVTLLPHLAREFDVSLVCLHEKGPLAAGLEQNGVPVRLIRFRDRWSPDALWRLGRYLRGEGARIVQTHMYGPGISGIASARLAGVPVRISTIHHHDHWRNPRRVRTDRALLSWRDAVFCVSEAVRRVYIDQTGCPEAKCRVMPNGIELEPFRRSRERAEVLSELDISPARQVVGVVGRLVPEKNMRLFVDTAARVRREREGVSFLVVGEGPEESALRDQARALGLSRSLVFTGLRSDIPDLVSALDCFVLPSVAEPFGIVLLESMAGGVPLVATDAGGVRDVVQDGKQGILVASGHADALAEAVLRILGDPALARRLGAGGLERAEEFRMERVSKRLGLAYRELLEAKFG
jgi:glycosyltransferase involved in cell wall biosynthesis